MGKISLKPYNNYCSQTLFLYGTYDEQGNPDFGLFCWFSYIWDKEMGYHYKDGITEPDEEYLIRMEKNR